MVVKLLEENRSLVQFNHVVDRNNALHRCPYMFNKNIVIFNIVREEENLLDVDLNRCPLYVHIHGLQICMMTKEVVEVNGNSLGLFLNSDHAHDQFTWGLKVYIRVALDVPSTFEACVEDAITKGRRGHGILHV
ncbi:UNVERIFIED_CONTAM: hypothetical protein Slati_0467800 [Sesamum latifolium]|uniref:Uncharacterized protein n=1 Tax=Sesamum latifolium TaxID=2727402 RepID=A0AAW2XXB9_9LAMI